MNKLLPLLPVQLNNVLSGLPYLGPEIALTVLFLVVLAADLLLLRRSGAACRIIACAGLLLTAGFDVYQYSAASGAGLALFGNMLLLTRGAVVLKLIIDLMAVLLLLYFPWDRQLSAHPKGLADGYTIILGSILGLHLMVMAVNLLSIYLAVEMVSVACYLLAAYQSDRAQSAEAGLKYVLFGTASSAVMLYGISLVYAFTGSVALYNSGLVSGLLQVHPPAMLLGLVLIFAGIGFKLGLVPLHFWVPDVYQGSATPVMAYISTLPKIGAFGLLVNVVGAFAFRPGWKVPDFQNILAGLSIVTMLAGNFAAVWQTNVKRMLAYSGIGHTGFALMGLLAFSAQGLSAMGFYLLIYALGNTGVLALSTYFKNAAGAEDLADYQGLGIRFPLASVCCVILLISLAGLPVTAGFNAKLLLFSSNYAQYAQTHNRWLLATLITGALTTVVSLFYYIKIPLNLFLRKQEKRFPIPATQQALSLFCVFITLVVLILGIFPDWITRFF